MFIYGLPNSLYYHLWKLKASAIHGEVAGGGGGGGEGREVIDSTNPNVNCTNHQVNIVLLKHNLWSNYNM